ncbi:hypothetical protein YQE_12489, partial [Dendroctonus ponderosae]
MKQMILNTKEPLLITNQMKCKLISWSLQDWKNELDTKLLKFRCGKNEYTEEPQWESKTVVKSATFQDFLNNINSNETEWWYFDYKYMFEWFNENDNFKEPQDDCQRIKEGIASILVGNMLQNIDISQQNILNPNMTEDLANIKTALKVIKLSVERCKEAKKCKEATVVTATQPNDKNNLELALDKYDNVCKIPVLNDAELKSFWKSQSARFKSNRQINRNADKTPDAKEVVDFLEVITDDEVLELITKKLLKR